MHNDEFSLSFGDDTIAAINHLEVSRLVGCDIQKQHENFNSINILSPRQSLDLSHLPVKKLTTNVEVEESLVSKETITTLCTQEKCDLSFWGLPSSVLQQYEARGIKSMFPWQVECLSHADVLEGRNLVYSAPTSAGKTLVAELLMMKTVLEKKKKAIVILPFVSVVREKMFYLKSLLESSGVRIEGLMGSRRLHGGIKNVDIVVCTIEKANALINRLMEEDSLHNIGIVVVDELHLLGDPFRGYLLELLITKIRYMSTMNDEMKIQIVGMSATLPNLELLSVWLDAHLYKTDFRPIPLKEFLKVESIIYSKTLQIQRNIEPHFNIQDDPDHVIHLCLETIFNGHSCLIFCPTKNWCEKLAQNVAREIYRIGSNESEVGTKLREQLKSEALVEALEQLKGCPVGLDHSLGKCISFGVAFHHAGLTIDERDIIEGLFRSSVIRVLAATSTLSSGVNLPARRVLIRTPIFHRKPLDVQVYKQMVGRAGRMGRDTAGESFLICNKRDQKIGEQIIQDDLKPIASCLGHGELSSSLKRAILEVIASGVAETPEQVQCYSKCTLLATSHMGLENPVDSCITFLLESEFIRLHLDEYNTTKYLPTPLGNACLAASMSPDDGLELFQELQKARQCFVLENELHLIYLVTPYSVSAQWGNLDWLQIMSLWEKLSPSMKRVGSLVGVDEAFMVRALRGTVNLHNHKQLYKLSIHRRFYTALALQELVNEVPLVEVAERFQTSKGMLQSLQQTSATFAGMVTAFCKRLCWKNLELLISQFQDRLQFGVHRELCELMQLDLLNGPRARALFNAGITSLGDLASADICQVENALRKSVTFETSKEMEGETAYDAAHRNHLKTIWITGKEGLTERQAAELLIKEARLWLQHELGLVDVKWENDNNDSNVREQDHSNLKESSVFSQSANASCNNMEETEKNTNAGNNKCKELLVHEGSMLTTVNSKEGRSVVECNEENSSFQNASSSQDQLLATQVNKNIEKDTSELNCVLIPSELNDTIPETQDSDNENKDVPAPEKHTNHDKVYPESPINDIFDASLDVINDCLSYKNSSKSFLNVGSLTLSGDKEKSCLESSDITFIPSVVMRSSEVFSDGSQKTTNSDQDSDVGSTKFAKDSPELYNLKSFQDTVLNSRSRYSLDLFDSPVPVKSPLLFEDSLVIDSCLGNLLDKEAIDNVKSAVGSEKKADYQNVSKICNQSKKEHYSKQSEEKTKTPKKELIQADNILRPFRDKNETCDIGKTCIDKTKRNVNHLEIKTDAFEKKLINADPFIEKKITLDVEKTCIGKKERFSEIFNENSKKISGEFHSLRNESLIKIDCHTHQLNVVNKTTKGDQNASSIYFDDFSDSFLQQAFTSDCHFSNSKANNNLTIVEKTKSKSIHTLEKNYVNIIRKNDVECLPRQDKTQSPKDVKSAKLVKVSSLSQEDNDIFIDSCYINPETVKPDKIEHTRKVNKKLTFVSDTDEDGDDLVPSSQSQTDASSYHLTSHSSFSRKKKQNNERSLIKRKRFEEADNCKLESTSIESDVKKLKIQSSGFWDSFKIVDVCTERKIFEEFKRVCLSNSHIAISVACEKWIQETPKETIGDRILGKKRRKIEGEKQLLINANSFVTGLAVCLGDYSAYYIALDTTVKVEGSQRVVTFGEQLQLLESLMTQNGKHFVSAFDIKEHYKVLSQTCSVNIEKEICDPKVAEWMLDSESDEKSLRSLMSKYLPFSLKLLKRVGNVTGIHSLGLNSKSSVRGRIRACVEAVITWHLINAQLKRLEEYKLLNVFKEVEMPTVMCLARMEINGIGYCREEAGKLLIVLQNQLKNLEEKAFQLAHHTFSLSSCSEVSKVLYKELQLKAWKYTSTHRPSTSKDALLKLKDDHPLPCVILEWRKIHFIINKIIMPFLKIDSSRRLFGSYITHTVTGRINMHEPNLQSIPRNFDISLHCGENMTVSMREAFVPKSGKSFISADYSQLELRLLAHLSQDQMLLDILKSGGDVFKSVAAKWEKIPEDHVSDNLRQKAKQVCYGVIYGIGATALSDQLEVDEEEAASFMQTFLNAYPGIKKYRQDVIQKCREKGFVETLSGRKRFLPLINSDKPQLRAQAERQAVNTTVQGSAADIAKRGMVLVEASLKAAFRNESLRVRRLRENKRQYIEPCVATLVLHLHDELLYEVNDEYVDEIIHIIKGGMEAAANLSVLLPVRVKHGRTWGTLKEVS